MFENIRWKLKVIWYKLHWPKWIIQRAKYGVSEYDANGLDFHVLRVIDKGLEYYLKHLEKFPEYPAIYDRKYSKEIAFEKYIEDLKRFKKEVRATIEGDRPDFSENERLRSMLLEYLPYIWY